MRNSVMCKSLTELEFVIKCGPELPPSELNVFLGLVKCGGAVDESYVRRGLKRPGAKAVFAMVSGQTVGVAALKVPKDTYRRNIEVESGERIPVKTFEFELGYVSVHQNYRRKGLGKSLTERVVSLSSFGLFSTTGSCSMMRILCDSGFSRIGNPWRNDSGQFLHLFVRPET